MNYFNATNVTTRKCAIYRLF